MRMATRGTVECPLCRDEIPDDRNLEDHLLSDHTKRRIARFVVAETEALNETDISE